MAPLEPDPSPNIGLPTPTRQSYAHIFSSPDRISQQPARQSNTHVFSSPCPSQQDRNPFAFQAIPQKRSAIDESNRPRQRLNRSSLFSSANQPANSPANQPANQPTNQPANGSTPSTFPDLPTARTAKEALSLARNMVIQASGLARTQEEQTNILDLLEVFRDYTEKGRVNKHAASVFASQISNLETVSRTLGSKAQSLRKPAAPAVPKSTTHAQQPTQQPKAASYATTAAQNPPHSSDWQIVGKKTTPTSVAKNSLSSRQLVLVQEASSTFNPLVLRNAFNQAFAKKGVNSPVVASVTLSRSNNLVLTTTPTFTAKYLLEKKEIWQNITQFKEALPIQPWHKVAIHNIPTTFSTNESLLILKSEATTFNKGLEIVGKPYWLTSKERRREQTTGTVCIAFATEQEAQRAIRNRLYLLGISVRAVKFYSTPATTQCQKCQGFGHEEARCKGTTACKICGEAHATRSHKCNTCNSKGKACLHTVLKCVNCLEAHTADNKECEIFLATAKPRNPVLRNDDFQQAANENEQSAMRW